jgi:hypothetical protein
LRVVFRLLLRLLLPFGLLAAACGGTPSGPAIHYDPCKPLVLVPAADARPEEVASTREAAAMWNALGLTRMSLEEVDGAEHIPVVFRDAPDAFRGIYEEQRGDVAVNRRLGDARQRAVVIAHELGHAVSLHHVDPSVRVSVMNPANLDVAPTGDDGSAMADAWGRCASAP